MKYSEVKNCAYADANGTYVDCDVFTDQHGWIPTTVDLESDSRARLIALVVKSEIQPYVEPEPEPLTEAQEIALITSAVQNMLNREAQLKGYDTIHTAALRAAIPTSPFHAEGLAFAEWMDSCFSECYSLLEKWKLGELSKLTPEEVVLLMPELTGV